MEIEDILQKGIRLKNMNALYDQIPSVWIETRHLLCSLMNEMKEEENDILLNNIYIKKEKEETCIMELLQGHRNLRKQKAMEYKKENIMQLLQAVVRHLNIYHGFIVMKKKCISYGPYVLIWKAVERDQHRQVTLVQTQFQLFSMMDLQSVSLKVVWKYMDVVYSITFPPFELKRNSDKTIPVHYGILMLEEDTETLSSSSIAIARTEIELVSAQWCVETNGIIQEYSLCGWDETPSHFSFRIQST